MKDELLKYLKSSIDRDWLQHYSLDSKSNQEINRTKYCYQKLYQLTQSRLTEISAIIAKQSQPSVVFIVEKNPLNFITAFLAGVIAEVNLFLCDPTWKQQEWQQVLNLVTPDLVYADRTTQDLIVTVGSRVKNQIDNQSNLPGSALIMIPTGGTSGKIRFAMHSWDTLTASVTGFKDYFACQQINSFCTLPLYHVSGLMQFMRSFLTQGNLVFCSYKIVKTKQITLNIQDYFISLVPTQLKFLIESIPDWLTQFKIVLLGGAPAARSLLDTAREYNIAIALTYGMTETASGIVTLKPEDFLAGNNSSGRVLPHAEVTMITASRDNKVSEEVEITKIQRQTKPINNKTGLIKISCKSLCLGYYPQSFNSTQPFVTDDLGYFDNQGYLHLVGRNSQKIITGGENVFPIEVEEVIYSTKLVKDVCVVGIPDNKWGEAVTAIYVPLKSDRGRRSSASPGFSKQKMLDQNLSLIKQKIKSQLVNYKLPKNWIEVESIPHNNRGKINYQKLKAIAEQLITNN